MVTNLKRSVMEEKELCVALSSLRAQAWSRLVSLGKNLGRGVKEDGKAGMWNEYFLPGMKPSNGDRWNGHHPPRKNKV